MYSVLCALAVGWWLYSHAKGTNREASNHVLITTVVSAALPHVLKLAFNQTRPDRRTVQGHWQGVEFSGRRKDAFPSGHALHIGALSSAATMLPKRHRIWAWSIGAALATTRVLVLAHWVSDVAAGLVAGVIIERLLRMATGFNHRRNELDRTTNPHQTTKSR